MLPSHSQKWEEGRGQCRMVEEGSQLRWGLTASPSSACRAVIQAASAWSGRHLRTVHPRTQGTPKSCTLRALSPRWRGIFSLFAQRCPLERNPLPGCEKVQVNTLCRASREKRLEHRALLCKGQDQSKRVCVTSRKCEKLGEMPLAMEVRLLTMTHIISLMR